MAIPRSLEATEAQIGKANVVLDNRSQGELDREPKVDGAAHVPMDQIDSAIASGVIPQDKSTPIVAY